eukprot:13961101-Heterocapsa_arctica.AAC.1
MGQRVQELNAVAQEGDLYFFPGPEVAAPLAQHVEGELDLGRRVERHVAGVAVRGAHPCMLLRRRQGEA